MRGQEKQRLLHSNPAGEERGASYPLQMVVEGYHEHKDTPAYARILTALFWDVQC